MSLITITERKLNVLGNDEWLLQWDDRKARGLFHHDIATCETKVSHSSLINFTENSLGGFP